MCVCVEGDGNQTYTFNYMDEITTTGLQSSVSQNQENSLSNNAFSTEIENTDKLKASIKPCAPKAKGQEENIRSQR